MMLPSLTKIGIVVDFKINQDFIAEVLCINKDKPTLNCNGKCHLSKQLREADEQEEKQAPPSKKEQVELLYYQANILLEVLTCAGAYIESPKMPYQCSFYRHSFITDVFRPPQSTLS